MINISTVSIPFKQEAPKDAVSLIYHLQSIKEQDISYSFSHCSNH